MATRTKKDEAARAISWSVCTSQSTVSINHAHISKTSPPLLPPHSTFAKHDSYALSSVSGRRKGQGCYAGLGPKVAKLTIGGAASRGNLLDGALTGRRVSGAHGMARDPGRGVSVLTDDWSQGGGGGGGERGFGRTEA